MWRIIPHRFQEGRCLKAKTCARPGSRSPDRDSDLEILEGSPTRHMSAEGIYKRLIESQRGHRSATVYRCSTQFQGRGIGLAPSFEDGMAVFELNQGTQSRPYRVSGLRPRRRVHG